MKEFTYTIKSEVGIHARPAGILVSKASKFKCNIVMRFGEKEASVKKLFALMKMGVKKDDTITVSFDGEDESEAYEIISSCLGECF